jgi:hypothetical protein
MTTRICKDVRGNWKAWSDIDLSPTLRLRVSTYKIESGAVVTAATVSKVDGIWECHTIYKDFSKRLGVIKHPRVTAKVVETQHSQYDITAIVAEAKAFYHI